MSKFNRKICDQCKCVFTKEMESQNICVRCLTENRQRRIRDEYLEMKSDLFGTKINVKTCSECNTEFKVSGKHNRKTCSDFCFSKTTKRKNKEIIDPIQKANEKWLTDKKDKTGFNPVIMDKKAEYKRVFDDKGWDHFLKGRKYDKI